MTLLVVSSLLKIFSKSTMFNSSTLNSCSYSVRIPLIIRDMPLHIVKTSSILFSERISGITMTHFEHNIYRTQRISLIQFLLLEIFMLFF